MRTAATETHWEGHLCTPRVPKTHLTPPELLPLQYEFLCSSLWQGAGDSRHHIYHLSALAFPSLLPVFQKMY